MSKRVYPSRTAWNHDSDGRHVSTPPHSFNLDDASAARMNKHTTTGSMFAPSDALAWLHFRSGVDQSMHPTRQSGRPSDFARRARGPG